MRSSWLACMLLLGASTWSAADRVSLARTPDISDAIVDDERTRIAATGDEVVAVANATPTLTEQRFSANQQFATLFEEAKSLYLAEDYERAIRRLLRAESDLLPVMLDSAGGRGVLRQANEWLGCLYLASGDKAKALSRFRLVFALDPSARLDETLWPPKYVARFEDAREMSVSRGTLAIQLTSQHASLWIDGNRHVPKSFPATLQLPAGDHYVFAHSPGFKRSAFRARVPPGGVKNVSVRLGRASAAELSHDLNHLDPSWLTERSVRLANLASAADVDRLVVLTGGGKKIYDRRGVLVSDGTPATGGAISAQQASTPIYKKWWFWTGVVAIAGGGALLWATAGSDSEAGTVTGVFTR